MGGQLDLMRNLLQSMVDPEVCDSRGRTALAVATSSRQWDAVDVLLSEGCRVSGYSGNAAISELRAACVPGPHTSYEEIEQVTALLERALEREQRAPCLTLAEYFVRQARGEVVQGIEPRRFKREGSGLLLRSGSLRVSASVVILDSRSVENDVCFVPMEQEEYDTIVGTGVIDVKGRKVCNEQQLIKQSVSLALAVAVPCGQLRTTGADQLAVVPARVSGPMAAMLPLVARAPPPGGLAVESMTCCCGERIGRVEILVDGVRVGETDSSGGVELLIPPREFEVHADFSGRRLQTERIVGDPEARMSVNVSIAVYVYVVVIDEEQQLEFVSVCGHRRDLPDDSKPFKGTVTWDQGSQRLTGVQPAVLGELDCLERLRSMQFSPDLAPGRCWEAVEWEDTSSEDVKACQFQRILNAPVRVGKIFNG